MNLRLKFFWGGNSRKCSLLMAWSGSSRSVRETEYILKHMFSFLWWSSSSLYVRLRLGGARRTVKQNYTIFWIFWLAINQDFKLSKNAHQCLSPWSWIDRVIQQCYFFLAQTQKQQSYQEPEFYCSCPWSLSTYLKFDLPKLGPEAWIANPNPFITQQLYSIVDKFPRKSIKRPDDHTQSIV